jgi:hypothetical protein
MPPPISTGWTKTISSPIPLRSHAFDAFYLFVFSVSIFVV